jgi:hypothetical protein
MNQNDNDRLHAIAQELLLHVAAPDLLVALRFALERLEEVRLEQRYDHKTFDWDGNDIAIDIARAAIYKATGVDHGTN